MVKIESYTKLRRAKGRITKGLYNQIKKLEKAVNNIETPDLGELLEDYDLPEILSVEVNISTGNSTGSSSANNQLIGATVVGVVPNGNQDQFIKQVSVAADGKITVSLVANALEQNKFTVSLVKSTEE